MRSGFIDSLKLVFSDDYKIPDDSYMKLSGILVKNGMSEDAFDSGLIQLIKVILKNHLEFPISINLLQSFWDVEGKAFNFVHTLVPMVKLGYIKLKRVDKEKALSNDVMIGDSEKSESVDSYVVVYSTDALDEVLSVFSEVLSLFSKEYSASDEEIMEGVSRRTLPGWLNRTVDMVNMSFAHNSIDEKIICESYIPDEATGKAEVGFLVTGSPFEQVNKGIVPRSLQKYLKSEKDVKVLDGYVDGNSDLYISISIPVNFKAFKRLSEGIYLTVKGLGENYA